MGDVNKNVSVKVSAESAGNPADPFNKLSAAAKQADADVGNLGKSLKNLANQERGFERMSHGAMQLSMSLGQLDPQLAKVAGHMTALHGVGQVLRGASAMGGALAVLGPLAAAAMAAGYAYSQLADKVKKAADELRDFNNKTNLSNTMGQFGFNTSEREGRIVGDQQTEARYKIEKPFRDRQDAMREQAAESQDKATAAAMFPQTAGQMLAGHQRGEQISEAGQNIREALEGKGRGDLQGGLAQLKQIAGGELPEDPMKARAVFAAEQKGGRAATELEDANAKLQNAKEGNQLFKAQAELQAAIKANSAAQTDLGKAERDKADSRKLDPLNSAQHIVDQVGRLAGGQGVDERLKIAQGRAGGAAQMETDARDKLNALRGRVHENLKPASGAELQQAEAEQAAASQKNLDAQNQITQAKLAQNQASVQETQELYKQLDAQATMAKEMTKAAEQRKEGAAVSFGLMTPEDQKKALSLNQSLKQGGTLEGETLKFAQQHQDIFGKAIREQGLRNADKAGFGDLAQGQGLNEDIEKGKAAEKEIKIAMEGVKNTLEVKLQAGDAMQAQLNEQLVPALNDMIKKSIEQMVKAIEAAMAKMVEEQINKAQGKQKDAQQAGAG